jgi:hypothetical protein
MFHKNALRKTQPSDTFYEIKKVSKMMTIYESVLRQLFFNNWNLRWKLFQKFGKTKKKVLQIFL